jgi:hypothetical protein
MSPKVKDERLDARVEELDLELPVPDRSSWRMSWCIRW